MEKRLGQGVSARENCPKDILITLLNGGKGFEQIVSELASKYSRGTINKYLNELYDAGEIRRNGRRGPYILTPEGKEKAESIKLEAELHEEMRTPEGLKEIEKFLNERYNRLILEALSEGEKTTREILERVAGHIKGSVDLEEKIESLTNKEFIEKITGEGEKAKYRLTPLGFMYVLHQTNFAGWKVDRNKFFKAYWPILFGTVKTLKEKIDEYSPLEKLLVLTFVKAFSVYEKPHDFMETFFDEYSSLVVKRLKNLILESVGRISEYEAIRLGVEAAREALRKYPTLKQMLQARLWSCLSSSFQELEEDEKFIAAQSFIKGIHEKGYRLLSKDLALKKAFMNEVKRAKPNQIVLYIKCPNCRYQGFTLQDGLKLLSMEHPSACCPACKNPVLIELSHLIYWQSS